MNKSTIVLAFVTVTSTSAVAYKETTHEELSRRAVDSSALRAQSALFTGLGLQSLDQEFPNSLGETRKVLDLFAFGARHEDSGLRSTRHFFDPTDGDGILAFEASPDWILDGEAQDDDEEFSYKQVRMQFLRALNLPTEPERSRAWGLTFQNLGHVIHHIQDMAQPQHVRNDAHLDTSDLPGLGRLALYPFKDVSHYEQYTHQHEAKWIGYAGARPPVRFTRAREYWTEASNRGLADFTNRNFVSKDSNFDTSDYPLPVPTTSQAFTLAELGLTNASALCNQLKSTVAVPPNGECAITFFASQVADSYSGETTTNQRASALSVFDQYLRAVDGRVIRHDRENQAYTVGRVFTLNQFTFDEAHRFLIPRAVAYSAGLIDHFFRGRLELAEPVAASNGALELKVRNTSGDGNTFADGAFLLYYDAVDGKRKPLPINAGGVLLQPLPPGEVATLTAALPGDVDIALDNPFVLAYTGLIGEEQGVAGLVLDVTAPGFVVNLSSTPPDGVRLGRLITKSAEGWILHPKGGLNSAGVDWKGRYRDGKPTRVLSWSGHRSRYFRDRDVVIDSSPWIIQGGKQFALAPGHVRGAAITTDASGKEWIVAITDSDVVYRRPNTRSAATALYHPQTAPEGWQLIASFPASPGDQPAIHPWLFNGDGTEAQTVREYKSGTRILRKRLKISMAGASASLADLGNSKITRTRRQAWNYEGCRFQPVVRVRYEDDVTTGGETLVAVDYADGQELLATVSLEESRTRRHSGSMGNVIAVDDVLLETASTVLHLGESDIELSATTIEVRGNGVHERGSEVRWSQQRHTTGHSHEVAFMDLRSRTVFLAGSRTEKHLSGEIVGTVSIPLSGSASTALEHQFWKDTSPTTVYASDPVSQPSQGFSGDLLLHLSACFANPGAEGVRSAVSSEDVDLALYAADPVQASGVGATDRDGNQFVSIAFRDDRGVPRFFNSLTGGDLSAIFGVDAQQTSFGARPN